MVAISLDRFSSGLADPQEEKVFCLCEGCDKEIRVGQLVSSFEGDLFCNDRCLFNYLGAVTITAGEE